MGCVDSPLVQKLYSSEQVDRVVEAIEFDGVPATGGSFRCASLALLRG